MIIPKILFHDTEVEWLKEIFDRENAESIFASSTLSKVYSAKGKGIKPKILLKDIIEDIDAVVYIGGAGASEYSKDYIAHKIGK